ILSEGVFLLYYIGNYSPFLFAKISPFYFTIYTYALVGHVRFDKGVAMKIVTLLYYKHYKLRSATIYKLGHGTTITDTIFDIVMK
ncbi:hypothetical protein, partial [Alkaliphilus hydrothermalis]